MAQVVSGLVRPASAAAFWEHLSAVLTDEVVLAEAVAVGMDWPEVADGQAALLATRRTIVRSAVVHDWVSRATSRVLMGEDAMEALAAARPWIEQAQGQSLGGGELVLARA